MKVHPGAYAATAAVVVAYLAVGVPASGEAGTTQPAPGAVQCPHDVPAALASQVPAAGTAVEVTVPRFTFLTSSGAGWVVRTNTAAPPDRRDQFVVLAGGGWSTAPAALERLVLTACG